MWDYDLARAVKDAMKKSDLEKNYYKGTYKSGQIVLYGGRIKFDLSRCNMAYSVRYQLKVDFKNMRSYYVPRTWEDGDQCWCLLDGGSVLIVAMA